MRIHHAIIRNYRLHRELELELDDRLTVVSGPNESGKSTLAEALHRALFLSSRAGGAAQRVMMPPSGATPEVELEFEHAGRKVHLHKFFGGTKGTTTLVVEGAEAMHGPEAEEVLAKLLEAETVGGKGAENKLRQAWGHLWVWQGESANDPLSLLGTVATDKLKTALEANDGASAFVVSKAERAVVHALKAQVDETFTGAGKPKAGSRLALAETRLADARSSLAAARQKLFEHERKLEDVNRAAEDLLTEGNDLVAVDAERQELEKIVHEIDQLEAQVAAPKREIEQIANEQADIGRKLAQLEEAAAEVEKIRVDHEATSQAEQVLRANVEAAAASARVRQAEFEQGDRQLSETRKNLDRARLAADWFKAAELVREREREQAALAEARRQRLHLEAERDAIAIRRRFVDELVALRDEVTKARAKVETLGARIELLENRGPVAITLDDRPLALGSAEVVTDETLLVVGSEVRLRIAPGKNLREARRKLEEAEQRQRERLEELGVVDVEEARAASEKRDALTVRLDELRKQAKQKGAEADDIETRVAQARADLERIRGRAVAFDMALPQSEERERWEALREDAEKRFHAAELAVATSRLTRDEAHRTLDLVEKEHAEVRDRAYALRQALEKAQTTWLDKVSRLGGSRESLHARQEELAQIRASREAGIGDIEARLEALDPDGSRRRLDLSLARHQTVEERVQNAKIKLAQGQALLAAMAEGTDPRVVADECEAAAARAEVEVQRERREAIALQHLDELFEAEQQAVSERLVRPLTERVGRYLQDIFGRDAKLALGWSDNGFGQLATTQVRRPSAGFQTFPFEALSGGAKEQVSVALRLALAEVLADQYGGGLPLVLDDAFTNSDPDRVRNLRSMLERAARTGKLQVVVLSCHPTDYAGLGRPIRLDRPPAQPTVAGWRAEPEPERSEEVPEARVGGLAVK